MQLGIGLLIAAVPTWMTGMAVADPFRVEQELLRVTRAVVRFFLLQVAALPGIWAGLSLCGFLPGGITPLAAGAILSMLVAILNAWILLIEILR